MNFRVTYVVNHGTLEHARLESHSDEVSYPDFSACYKAVDYVVNVDPKSGVVIAMIHGTDNDHFCGFGPNWKKASSKLR